MQAVINNRQVPFIQSMADYIRLSLLEQNGGVYLDLTSILINGMSWV
jgi:mannosyltransferase OCH1-like enzyme